jgi:hypothetical protein
VVECMGVMESSGDQCGSKTLIRMKIR